MLEKVEIRVPIQREDPAAPRYVVVPSKVIAAWELERTTEVDIEVNGKPGGRRRLRRWDDARWYIQLPESVCEELGVATGYVVTVTVRLAVHDLPGELVLVLAEHPEACERWDALTAPEQHRVREDVRLAQLPKTRWERAALALGVDAPAPDSLVKDLKKKQDREPLRVHLHFPPDSPESRAALDEALDVVADAFADMILYDAWKEAVVAAGRDPSNRDLVPVDLFHLWAHEFDPDFGKSKKRRGTKREKL